MFLWSNKEIIPKIIPVIPPSLKHCKESIKSYQEKFGNFDEEDDWQNCYIGAYIVVGAPVAQWVKI